MPRLREATPRDWEVFTRLASREGWRIPQREAALLRGAWAGAVQVLAEGELFCGLVSTVTHGRSGWIGNLLVPPRLRGRGFGQQLFAAALGQLADAGVSSIWLTASAQGAPLYARFGFTPVATIERWVLPARSRKGSLELGDGDWRQLADMDRQVWGGEREALFEMLASSSRVLCVGEAVALLQQDPDLEILGPWYAPGGCLPSQKLLLQQVVEVRAPRRELVIDLVSLSGLGPLLISFGFSRAGENLLMVRGECREDALQRMVALASLGSIG